MSKRGDPWCTPASVHSLWSSSTCLNQLCLTVFSSLRSSLLLVHIFLHNFFLPVNFAFNILWYSTLWTATCDECGGAESRGNGARPVEWMIMNDTCATHRSRVPRRSFGRNKRRSDDIGRRERTRPGFYFMFCVRTEDSLPCSWVEEGWLPSERERRSRPVRLEAEACCHPTCLGRSRERGTRCRLPSTGGATAVRQEADEHRAVHQRGPVPSHGTASEPLSWLRTERQCVWEPDRDFFFFSSLPSLVSVTPHPSVSFLSPRLSLPPGTPRPPWRAPPGRGGRGGVERSLVSTPRPARGDGGMWRVGRGREPWERSEAGGVNDNERHLRHSPVSSPTEELRKE